MIDSAADLRDHYPQPTGRAVDKTLDHLDVHCRRFLALASFAVLASGDASGRLDASPRGGAPGFVRVHDERTLWLPDAPGNNRLDSFSNIAETGRAGLLFLIPGVDETLRVNGSARVRVDPEVLGAFSSERRLPHAVLEVTVEEAYLHCAKALMRSRLWRADAQTPREALPPTSQILNDQTGRADREETQEEMAARYAPDL